MAEPNDDPRGSAERPLRLDRRVVWVWRLPNLVTILVLAGIGGVLAATAEDPGAFPAVVIGVAVVLLAAAVFVPTVQFRRWRYWITDDTLEVRHGIWNRVESSIPHFRVQHIDLHRRPLHRLFGVVEVRISTASVTSDAKLPGVAPDRAEALRQLVLERAQDDDAV